MTFFFLFEPKLTYLRIGYFEFEKLLIKRWSEAESFTIFVNHDYIH